MSRPPPPPPQKGGAKAPSLSETKPKLPPLSQRPLDTAADTEESARKLKVAMNYATRSGSLFSVGPVDHSPEGMRKALGQFTADDLRKLRNVDNFDWSVLELPIFGEGVPKMTALQFVCSCKASAEHIEALLEFGANPNTTSPGVNAPLLLLVAGPHAYIPEFLKAAGARLDTNVTDKDGDVPIACALKLRKFKAAEQILDAPACKYDPTWKDKDGATCLQIAVALGCPALILAKFEAKARAAGPLPVALPAAGHIGQVTIDRDLLAALVMTATYAAEAHDDRQLRTLVYTLKERYNL